MVMRCSPDKSDFPFLNFPKRQKAKCRLTRHSKQSLGIFNPTFSYKSKSPESMVNSWLQFRQILVSLFVFIYIHPGWAQNTFGKFVTFLDNQSHFVIQFFFVGLHYIDGLMNTRIKSFPFLTYFFYSVFFENGAHLSMNVFHSLPPIWVHFVPGCFIGESHVETVYHGKKSCQNSLPHGFGKQTFPVFFIFFVVSKIRAFFLPAGQVLFFFFFGHLQIRPQFFKGFF